MYMHTSSACIQLANRGSMGTRKTLRNLLRRDQEKDTEKEDQIDLHIK